MKIAVSIMCLILLMGCTKTEYITEYVEIPQEEENSVNGATDNRVKGWELGSLFRLQPSLRGTAYGVQFREDGYMILTPINSETVGDTITPASGRLVINGELQIINPNESTINSVAERDVWAEINSLREELNLKKYEAANGPIGCSGHGVPDIK